ncbi:hypothetical protein ACIBG0_25165 [Nocardia sp. NPDC050630]|uniref:hypothetical protein n=1 Tax=Nocardia sp. NPDC050630 TaxID=3364321 RepID=UPI00378F5DC2
MRLSQSEAEMVGALVAEAVARRLRVSANIPPWLIHLRSRVRLELSVGSTDSGRVHELATAIESELAISAVGNAGNANKSESEIADGTSALIGAKEAARLIGCTDRQIRNLAADLDGRKVDGRWLFNRRVVLAYAAGRQE